MLEGPGRTGLVQVCGAKTKALQITDGCPKEVEMGGPLRREKEKIGGFVVWVRDGWS